MRYARNTNGWRVPHVVPIRESGWPRADADSMLPFRMTDAFRHPNSPRVARDARPAGRHVNGPVFFGACQWHEKITRNITGCQGR